MAQAGRNTWEINAAFLPPPEFSNLPVQNNQSLQN
jgi:hypothetical protein